MRYYKAREAERASDLVYRAYVTDALKAAVTNTMRHAVPGIGMIEDGVSLKNRWIELQQPVEKKEEPQEDNRPAAEIAADMWKRIRGGK